MYKRQETWQHCTTPAGQYRLFYNMLRPDVLKTAPLVQIGDCTIKTEAEPVIKNDRCTAPQLLSGTEKHDDLKDSNFVAADPTAMQYLPKRLMHFHANLIITI